MEPLERPIKYHRFAQGFILCINRDLNPDECDVLQHMFGYCDALGECTPDFAVRDINSLLQ